MPKPKHTELAAWRQSHFAELEATLIVLKGIRDDPEAKDKDVIEASKGIGRLLAALSPAKHDPKKGIDIPKNGPKKDFSDEELDDIRSRLAA